LKKQDNVSQSGGNAADNIFSFLIRDSAARLKWCRNTVVEKNHGDLK
jgi:hypothetical protein